MKRVLINTLVILGVLILAGLVFVFREAVVLFLLSLGAAAATRPLVDRLIARGWPRGLSIFLVYLLSFGVLIGTLAAVSGPLFIELERAGNQLATNYDRLYATWPTGTDLQQTIVSRLPPPQDLYAALAGEQGATVGQAFLGVTQGFFTIVSNFIAVIILSIYWSIDRIYFERLWLSLLPVESRARARDIWRDIELNVGDYIRSEVIQSLLAGLLLGLGFWLMGLPYPTLLALVGAILWLIPWVGGGIALIPIGLVGLTVSPLLAALAVGYTVTVLLIMELLIEPRIVHRQYNALILVLFVLALADVFGLVGLLIAPPLAAAVQQLFGAMRQVASQPSGEIESVRQIANLNERLVGVREMITNMDTDPEPQSLSMLSRLETLVGKARELADTEMKARIAP